MAGFLKGFGVVLMLVSGLGFFGWFYFDWGFVDPFLATLVFFSGPFFAGMGIANPRPAEVFDIPSLAG